MFFWATLEKNIPFLLNFFFTIIIARLVSPETYGLVAMTAILTAVAGVLQNLGFAPALVQRKDLTEGDVTTVFIVNVTIGTVLAVLLILSAKSIADFFGYPEVQTIVNVNAAILFFAALGIVQAAMLQRNYGFKTGLIIELAATMAAGLIALATALYGAELWALLLLMLVREGTRTFLLWILIRWYPRGRFSLVSFRSLWSYARHMIGASLYHQAATNLASVLIGKLYDPLTLGLFGRAQSLQLLPVSLLTQPLQRVAFPLYSRSQDDWEEVLRQLRMHSRIASFLAGIITAILSTGSSEIVLILFGQAWTGSIPLLSILAWAAFFNITFPLHSEANKAIGKSRWFFWIEVAKKTLLVGLIAVGIFFGIDWLLWALVLSSLTDYLLSALSSRRFLKYSWRSQLADIGPAIGLAFVSVSLVWIAEFTTGVSLRIEDFSMLRLFASLGIKLMIVFAVFGVAISLTGRRLFPEAHGFILRTTRRVLRQSASDLH